MSTLRGKTALITGASGGIGSALAIKLASEGCNLFLVCRKNVYPLLAELKAYQVGVEVYACDFTKKESVSKLLSRLEQRDIDLLVNNAGIFPIKSILDSDEQDFDDCFSVNVRAPFLLSRQVAKHMRKKGWGRIINIGSSSSYNGSGETGVYCASKHALLGLSRSLFQELRKDNIRVYSVSPGSAQTPMGATDTRQDFSTFITPEEIAEYILFITSFDNEGISEEIRINRMVIR